MHLCVNIQEKIFPEIMKFLNKSTKRNIPVRQGKLSSATLCCRVSGYMLLTSFPRMQFFSRHDYISACS